MFGLENSANNFGASAGLLANTLANRPVQAALGTLFVGTNNLILYRYNGSTWDIIGGGGISSATNGLNVNASQVRLGGALITNTQIETSNFSLDFYASSTSTAQFKVTNAAPISELAYFTSISTFNDGGVYIGNNELRGTIQSKSFATQTPTELRINYDGGSIQLGNGNFGMMLDDATPMIQTMYSGVPYGLVMNFDTNYFTLGNADEGLQIYLGNKEYLLGDVGGVNNGTKFLIDDADRIIQTYGGNEQGLYLDFSNRQFKLGDYMNNQNGYWLMIDDVNEELIFNGTNLESSTAGGNSGQHLVIVLNGNPYKIKLENP